MVKDMTVGNPTKLIFSFAVPMLIGNIFQQFYSMVDAIIVGRFVGVQALAAVGATGAMNFLVLGFVMGLTTGFSIIVAQYFGFNDENKLRKSVAMSVYLSIISTIIITVLSLLLSKPLLMFMNTPTDILDDANKYISIIFAGIIVTIFYNLLSSVLRALGDSKTPLYFLVISSIINVILDLVFVISFSMGVAGAAYATIISQAVSCVLCLIYMSKKHPILKLKKNDWDVDYRIIKKLLNLGIPTALQSSVTAVGVMVIQSTINNFGSTIVAAYTAASKVEQLATQPGFTFGLAMATYTGQNLGAGKIERIGIGLKKCIKLSMIFSIIGTILVFIFGGNLTQLFVSGEQYEVIAASKKYLDIVSIFFFVLGLLFIYRNALQGLGNAFVPLLSGVLELLMRVGVALTLSSYIGYTGICLASPIAWIAATILLIVAYYKNINNLKYMGNIDNSKFIEKTQTSSKEKEV